MSDIKCSILDLEKVKIYKSCRLGGTQEEIKKEKITYTVLYSFLQSVESIPLSESTISLERLANVISDFNITRDGRSLSNVYEGLCCFPYCWLFSPQ